MHSPWRLDITWKAIVLLSIFLLMFAPQPSSAQLGGENLRGDFGLKSGSQAPPGYYLGDMFYFYDSSEVRLAGGAKIPGPSLHLFGNFFLLNWVSEKKFLARIGA